LSFAALLLVQTAPDAARAADPGPLSIDIPAQPVNQALVALALRTGVSIGGVDPVRCGPLSRAVRGRMTPERALRSMLANSMCDVKRIDSRTFRLDLRSAPPRPVVQLSPIEAFDTEEVLVTRRPVRAELLPRAVSVVSGGAIIQNDFDLAKLASRVPGMTITNLGPGRNKIMLRGISDSILTGRTQSTVGLYLDDSPLTYNAPDPDLLLIDVARVEVLKGPQGALYGQGSLSGVVRVVTNRPRLDRFEADIGAGAGSTEGGDMSWRVTGLVNVPLIRDTLAVRAVAYKDESGGFVENNSGGRKTSNATTRIGGRAALTWAIDDRYQLEATAATQSLSTDNSQYVLDTATPFRRGLDVAEPHDNRFVNLSAGIEGKLEKGTLKLFINHLRHDISTGYDAEPLRVNLTAASVGDLLYDEDQSLELTTGEFSLMSPSNQRLRWLIGMFLARADESFEPHLSDANGVDVYEESRRERVDDLAGFGHIIYDMAPRWTASLGLRLTGSRRQTYSVINDVALNGYTASAIVRRDTEASRFAHTFVVNYQAREGMILYAQTADGFRTGGFNTLSQGTATEPSTYLGDALSSFEAGMKLNTSDRKLRVTATAFRINWRDIQSDQWRDNGLPVTVNLGDGVNTGFEFEADWRVTPSLVLHGAALVNDPKLSKPAPPYIADKNSGLPFIAKHYYALSADWSQDILGWRVQNSATVSYRSRSPLNYGLLREVYTDGYTLVDVSSFLDLGQLRIGARVNNLTDIRTNSFAYGNPFSINGPRQITPLRPRTVWFSINRQF
jgi:iron complex outermembrane recepter protein